MNPSISGNIKPALQTALSYAAMGWHVAPAHSIKNGACTCGNIECTSPGKHPRTKIGFKDATLDRDQIREWWKKCPDANVLIATGKVSDIAVVDVDFKNDGLRNFKTLQHKYGEIPKTITVATGGGGVHYFFKYPAGGFKSTIGKIAPGIDTRGDGGYVIAPPSDHISGKAYQFLYAPGEVELASIPQFFIDTLNPRKKKKAGFSNNGNRTGPIFEGARNSKLTSFAGTLKLKGHGRDEIYKILTYENKTRCTPPLDQTEIKKITDSISGYPHQRALSDIGNAERFADQWGNLARYCSHVGKWFIQNQIKWEIDESGQIIHYAMLTVKSIFEEAKYTDDKNKQKLICKHAVASQSRPRLMALIDLSKHMLNIKPEEFDCDPYLINALNGTVDLKKRKLIPHNPAHYISKNCKAKFDPQAKCPTFLQFMNTIMDGDQEMIFFMQRLCGYCITGSTEEQKLFIFNGAGCNGKSTLVGLLIILFNDYGKKAEMRSFMTKKSEGANNDIATLCGARFVSAVEAGQGNALNESLIKELTGGDPISARFLFHELFTFYPKFKLIFATNVLPEIKESTSGIWRRIINVPFNVTIPEVDIDTQLINKLQKELDGIFFWIIQGAVEWVKSGLQPPKKVLLATKKYRNDEDLLANYISEICHISEQWGINTPATGIRKQVDFVSFDAMYRSFIGWVGGYNQGEISKKLFSRMMSEHGFQSIQKKINGINTKVYKGIVIKEQHDFDFD